MLQPHTASTLVKIYEEILIKRHDGTDALVQEEGVKDKEEVKQRWGGGDGRGWGDEVRERGRSGNRGGEGGVIIYQVFGCAWQRRKLISTLCVHQLHRQASGGIPLASPCEGEQGHMHLHSPAVTCHMCSTDRNPHQTLPRAAVKSVTFNWPLSED